MNELRDGFINFWEILTGVFNDHRSKILRLTSFVVLFLGCIWAALNYFRAERISDLNETMNDTPYVAETRGRNEALENLMAAAKTVGTMRRGGEAIATALDEMNTKPFNLDGYDEFGLEDLSGVSEFAPDSVPEREEERKELLIKALMISGRTRYAVIDYASQKGAVVRQGQELPGGGGRVVKITQEGITVKENDREFVYTLSN